MIDMQAVYRESTPDSRRWTVRRRRPVDRKICHEWTCFSHGVFCSRRFL